MERDRRREGLREREKRGGEKGRDSENQFSPILQDLEAAEAAAAESSLYREMERCGTSF